MSKMAHPPVDAVAPCTSTSGRHSAVIAAATTGRSGGRQPASTALIATFSAVTARDVTGSTAITWSGGRPAHSSIAPTRAGVGATTGRPSVQPHSRAYCCAASSSASWCERAASGIGQCCLLTRNAVELWDISAAADHTVSLQRLSA